MRSSLAVLAAVLSTGLVASGCSKGSDDLTIWQADLAGSNEVPARDTAASGTAGITFDGTNLSFVIRVQNIDDVILAHIHSGAAGANGPVRVDLFLGPSTSVTDGTLAEGTLTAANVRGVTFEELLDQMRTGNAYVNVHTTRFPGGEIRGQTRMLQ